MKLRFTNFKLLFMFCNFHGESRVIALVQFFYKIANNNLYLHCSVRLGHCHDICEILVERKTVDLCFLAHLR